MRPPDDVLGTIIPRSPWIASVGCNCGRAGTVQGGRNFPTDDPGLPHPVTTALPWQAWAVPLRVQSERQCARSATNGFSFDSQNSSADQNHRRYLWEMQPSRLTGRQSLILPGSLADCSRSQDGLISAISGNVDHFFSWSLKPCNALARQVMADRPQPWIIEGLGPGRGTRTGVRTKATTDTRESVPSRKYACVAGESARPRIFNAVSSDVWGE